MSQFAIDTFIQSFKGFKNSLASSFIYQEPLRKKDLDIPLSKLLQEIESGPRNQCFRNQENFSDSYFQCFDPIIENQFEPSPIIFSRDVNFWTETHDIMLEKVVILYSRDWKKIQKRINRLYSQMLEIKFLKERFQVINKKKNNIKKNFNQQEDELLMKSFEKEGSKWVKISQLFPHRCPLTIKNRYYYLMRKQQSHD